MPHGMPAGIIPCMRDQRSIRALFDKTLREAQNARVKAVHLALGEAAGIDPDSIRAFWSEWSRGTVLEHAALHFRLIKAEVQCMACFKKYHPVNGEIHCLNCGSFGAKIITGEEFHVESIETDSE